MLDISKKILSFIPYKLTVPMRYFLGHFRLPRISKPKTFSEKIIYRKLFENNDSFSRLSDKVGVKDFVSDRIGESFVIPTIWSGYRIDFDLYQIPRPFVIKSNHSSGWNIFIINKEDIDEAKIKLETDKWVHTPWRPYLCERWYNRIERKILIEPFIGNAGDFLADYKFFVFNGKVEFIQVDLDRFSDHKRSLYSPDWQVLQVKYKRDVIDGGVPRPLHLKEMLAAASKLGEGISFVRIDFYDLEAGPKFGEMTFAPGGGNEAFEPRSFDYKIGKQWQEPYI